MKRILLTGMSGVGKSSVIAALRERGLSELVTVPADELTGLEPGQDWVWQEDRTAELLARTDAEILFLSGCSSNQGKFYPQFDHIILLSAPAQVIVERLASRTNNPYGKLPEEVARTLQLQQTIEPLLRQGAHHEIDTRVPLDQVVDQGLQLVHGSGSRYQASDGPGR